MVRSDREPGKRNRQREERRPRSVGNSNNLPISSSGIPAPATHTPA